jgi:peptide/nickel transport system permease protein
MKIHNMGYWDIVWQQFKKHRLGMTALGMLILFCLAGIYAPLLASSKPLFVIYNDNPYFPLFRYLFYTRFYTKWLDIFFNLLMFTLPLFILAIRRWRLKGFIGMMTVQVIFFLFLVLRLPHNPAGDAQLEKERQQAIQESGQLTWQKELSFMNDYAKLNLLLRIHQYKHQEERLERSIKEASSYATLWELERSREQTVIEMQRQIVHDAPRTSEAEEAQARLAYIEERRRWIDDQLGDLHMMVMPLVRPFHWEDDAGGEQSLNKAIPWWELTRINRKDLVAALIFGIRISLVVGILSVGLALLIGIPIGALAGYYGGTFDIFVSRLLEIWESMPTFFMLLMIVAITQSKSIFLVISVIGVFGWTTFSRYIRGETFKQRHLPYIEACKAIGFPDRHIIFSHILPNAIPPVLTLLPFAIMGAITSEAGLSFLGLGEEGSSSWGVLMDEGRSAFPGESYLLWPPAILLTILLVAIALVGDALRDSLDPKMHH